jgi:hypothetical protein
MLLISYNLQLDILDCFLVESLLKFDTCYTIVECQSFKIVLITIGVDYLRIL